ncbi:MAG TPA: hypothetical protein VK198_03615 [Terriglobales bacterium]|nr:hypothetical protein [Terriglobales bacterium]
MITKAAAAFKITDDLPRVVNARGARRGCARHVEWREAAAAAAIEEAASSTRAGAKSPDDLPRVVDVLGDRMGCARHVDLRKAETGGICGRAISGRCGDENRSHENHDPAAIQRRHFFRFHLYEPTFPGFPVGWT